MSAGEAMEQIDRITDDYIEAKISEIRALTLICREVGQYLGSKPMNTGNPTVTIEVTARELVYLSALTGFPSGRFPQLQAKLTAAAKDMREATRIKNRANKIARRARKQES